MKNGLLLINLGTPDSPSLSSVRAYLREFLADKRVIDLPAPLRFILLYAFILPFRAIKSTASYQKIWEKEGSPLLLHSKSLARKLQACLGNDTYQVELAMRYGNPSIEEALKKLQSCENLVVLPLYPQYSSAATGSSLEKTVKLLSKITNIPNLHIIRDFYQHESYIKAQTAMISPFIKEHDFILFSYHGIPERQLKAAGCIEVCKENCISKTSCYRSQCQTTTELLAKRLQLDSSQYKTCFQSKLGKAAWTQPCINQVMMDLAKQGIKRLAVCCPSFVADCVETLEEIGIGAKQQWENLGGTSLTLIPCLNDTDIWVQSAREIAFNH